jgi:hypothetical protein
MNKQVKEEDLNKKIKTSVLFIVNFRCIPVYSDLRGYFSTVTVYIIVSLRLNLFVKFHFIILGPNE